MIRRTIQEHLEKEKRLAPLGIKVLSLFFIDAVDHYRSYDEDGNAVKGKYATMFEEEYRRAAKLPEFSSLFKEVDLTSEAEDVHRSEEHTSELQSLMRISYAVFCLKKKKKQQISHTKTDK